MIYVLSTVILIQLVFMVYCLKHIRLINKELDDISREQHKQNMDILHMIQVDINTANAIDNHTNALNQIIRVTDYLLDISDKSKLQKDKPVFKITKGEA